ncbi:hypothetical protein HOP62_05690 [Halomonas sp. MCCC 1A17488]|uniref:Lipid/polyisoprenoid-binding YceI-like domain-containing protein n=1 Tax=Billgrantia sulfidoxydans TaxID=2733484 RepID=A0ABX7W3I6_9GAMM|nr:MULTISPECIES: hypothetical protein [Halomonas]MCE8015569.1 hypothetical protein [Halomonas sp. MCCC 1A17488]MCG3238902.1 hypothetical protein [Halomonas sp. MCCC 1A17488]QPP51141.1 hypothetical protein I4484_08705 [Halomonas sp. SS10-MC5]QTP54710.1 hypothetical protein HNO51_08455 [Halomonas sulfidoxydans]
MTGKHALWVWLGPWALLSLAAPLAASAPDEPEISGSMVGLLDGEEREWFIVSQGTDSNATFTELGDQVQIDLVGFVKPDDWQVRDSLSLSITLEEGEVTNFDVLHPIGATAMPPVFTSDNASVRLNLSTYEVQGSKVHVVGRVEGVLALQKELGEEAVEDEGIGISVEFDAEASRLEY